MGEIRKLCACSSAIPSFAVALSCRGTEQLNYDYLNLFINHFVFVCSRILRQLMLVLLEYEAIKCQIHPINDKTVTQKRAFGICYHNCGTILIKLWATIAIAVANCQNAIAIEFA